MPLKIENQITLKINFEKLQRHLEAVLEVIPPEHTRGLTKLVVVDQIQEPRLDAKQRAELPGLYHPRMPGSAPWLEVALLPLLPKDSFWKRISGRLSFKPNVTGVMLSLIGQHYHMTLGHGVKKSQYEQAVRAYVEKQFAEFNRRRGGWRAKLFRPFQPYLEKWAKALRKRYDQEARKKAKGAA
ncbi:MAG: hypothetical protein HY650_14535 [Acidobacteria bacterium]|nr:hypothetical protein [Acidobacteriota bacterium]